MARFSIGVIPGDGIGREVTPVAQEIVEVAGSLFGFDVAWREYPWGCEYYREHGVMMPGHALAELAGADAILLGAIGSPEVPDHVSLWGLLIPIRRGFDQYINLRPVRLLRGVRSPLAGRGSADIDFVVVRENVEGEYSEVGGRLYRGTDRELAVQESIFTRRGVDRVLTYAFELARSRPKKHLTAATKSNGIIHTMPFWDERLRAVAEGYPDVRFDKYHIDILSAHFVTHPDWFDVVVGSNLFGDILSDLGPAVAGGIGTAASANLNPERDHPSMFEPVHGSAPDIAGKGIANPIASIWTASLMLDHLGEQLAARAIMESLESVTGTGEPLTPDLGGSASTRDVAEAVVGILRN